MSEHSDMDKAVLSVLVVTLGAYWYGGWECALVFGPFAALNAWLALG